MQGLRAWNRCRTLVTASNSSLAEYVHTNDVAYLENATALLKQALDTGSNPDKLFFVLNEAALALRRHSKHSGQPTGAVADAVRFHGEALRLLPGRNPQRDTIVHNLGSALSDLFAETEKREVLYDALRYLREAMTLRPPGHPRRVATLHNLAVAYHSDFQHFGGTLIEVVVRTFRETLQLRPPGDPNRDVTLSGCASALDDLFRQTGQRELLDYVVQYHRAALDLRPEGHPDRATTLTNLAKAAQEQFDYFGDAEYLRVADELRQEALALRPPGHHRRSTSLNALAVSLCSRTLREGNDRARNIEESIKLLQEALALEQPGHGGRDGTARNLASVLLDKALYIGDATSIDQSVSLYREVLSLRPSGHARHGLALLDLANALSVQVSRSGNLSVRQESLKLLKQALACFPDGNPERFRILHDISIFLLDHPEAVEDGLRWGIEYFVRALSDAYGHPRRRLEKGMYNLWRVEDAFRLTHEASKQWSRQMILDSCQLAIRLLPRVAYFGLDLQARLRELTLAEKLSSTACAHALALQKPNTALELLEEGRAVFWTQALHLRAQVFDGLPQVVVDELTTLFRALEQGSFADARALEEGPPRRREAAIAESAVVARRRQSERAEWLISQVRTRPGFERFMLGQTFSALSRVAARGPVVVLVAATWSCDVIVIQTPEAQPLHVPLPALDLNKLKQMGELQQANHLNLRRTGDRQLEDDSTARGFGVRKTEASKADMFLGEIWRIIVRPVVDTLGLQKADGRSRVRVHWCPTGPFAFLPLHAAGNYTKPVRSASDFMVWSYTPTLGALLKAQHGLCPAPRTSVQALLVAEPSALKLPQLLNAVVEIKAISEIVSPHSSVVTVGGGATGATVEGVVAQLPRASILHLACHGQQDAVDPLNSGFCLRDGTLTVAQLMRLDLRNAVFAFLSACETAKGDGAQPDQMVHLAAAMLFVGFKSVIGTMWSIEDEMGPIVAKIVYRELFGKEVVDPEDVPYVLDTAVRELRRRGYRPHQWAPFIHLGA